MKRRGCYPGTSLYGEGVILGAVRKVNEKGFILNAACEVNEGGVIQDAVGSKLGGRRQRSLQPPPLPSLSLF